jgi:hypothetical protein
MSLYRIRSKRADISRHPTPRFTAAPILPWIRLPFSGATYTVYEMDVTVALLWTHYLPQKFDYTETAGPGHVTVEGEYKKDVIDIALGLSRK